MRSLKILTLTWNNQEKLTELYNSLIPALEGLDFRWLIRDNGSKDNTVEVVKSWNNKNIIIIAYKNNLKNYSEANNLLFMTNDLIEYSDRDKSLENIAYSLSYDKNINDDYLLLLNDDIIFQDITSLKKMISILDNDPEVGIVGAKLNYTSNQNIIQHAGVLYHPANIGTPFHFRAGKPEEKRDRKNRLYPAVTGAVLLTRASLFKEVGMLNEKLIWCWDDIDFCLKVQEAGKKVVYCGETNILHSESFSLKKNPVNKLFFQQNLNTFMSRWSKVIDKTLVEKYTKDNNYMIYKK